jgi:outer membrane receptor for ferrienterochelin and colicin
MRQAWYEGAPPRPHRGLTAILALGLAMGSLPAAADAPADAADLGLEGLDGFDLGALDDLDLEDELALLYAEDMVVSATRHEQRISESPSTITVISREDLASGFYRDLADVLRMVPGGDVYRLNPMTVNVGLRAGTTGTANRVLLLVDGRDMGLHATGQPQWNALPVDLDSIERIEIIRGPGSSIYGAGAFQGVVNVISRAPTDAPLTVESTISGAGPITFGADARAHGTHDRLRWWVNGGYEQEAFFEHPERRAFRARRGRARLSYDVGEGLEATVEAGYGDADGRFSSPVGDGAAHWSTPYALGRLRWPDTEVQISVEGGTGRVAPEVPLVAPANSLAEEPVDLGRIDPLELTSRSIEITGFHALAWREGHRLTVGMSGRAIHHLEGAILDCPEMAPHSFDLSQCEDAALLELRGGFFVQDEWRVTETLALTAGGRVDVNTIHPEAGLSPRLAMVWTPMAGHAVRTSVGRAYRKPSYLESYLNLRYRPEADVYPEVAARLQHIFAVLAPNPDLKNEKVTAVEAGWLGRFHQGRLVTTVDVYGMWFHDRVVGLVENVELSTGFGGVPRIHDEARISYFNADYGVWAIGGEAAISARPRPWLRLDGHYNYQGTVDVLVDEDGTRRHVPSDWTPAHRVNASARVDLPMGLRVGLSGHWSSHYARYIQNPESVLLPEVVQRTGGDVLVLGSASYAHSFGGSEVEVGVTGQNLLFRPIREFTGISREEGTWGGELLAPRARLFVRGRF